MSKRHQTNRFRLCGIILAAILLIRVYQVAIQRLGWQYTLESSPGWRLGLAVVAVLVSGVTAAYARNRIARPLAVLLSAFAGATTTLITTSVTGMIIGLATGICVVFDRPRRWSVGALKAVLPLAMCGITIGLGGSVAYFHVQPSMRRFILTCAAISALAVLLLHLWSQWRSGAPWKLWRRICSSLVFSFAIWFFIVVGIQLDTFRRAKAIEQTVSVWLNVGPWSPRMLLRGPYDAEEVWFGEGSTDAEIEYSRGLPYVSRIGFYSGAKITDDGLERIGISGLTGFYLQADPNSRITDRGFRALGAFPQLTSLDLPSAKITDDGLVVLRSFPNLRRLWLEKTKVSARGLRHLHPFAPLDHVTLKDTDVDDEVLSILGRYSMSVLDLSGTNIRGTGLWHLKDNLRLRLLVLSETDLQEEYLKELLTTILEDGKTTEGANVAGLFLKGIPITADGIKTLGRMRWIDRLVIPNATVDDDSIKPLAQLTQLWSLDIFANELTPEGFKSITQVGRLRLVYDAENLTTNEIVDRFQAVAEAHQANRKAKGFANPTSDSVELNIRHPVINRDTYRRLRKLEDKRFVEAVKIVAPRFEDVDIQHEGKVFSLDGLAKYYADSADEPADD